MSEKNDNTGNRLICMTIAFLFIFMSTAGVFSSGENGGSIELATGSNDPVEKINFTYYHTFEETTEYLENVASSRPDIAVLYSLGKTYEGRDVWALKISDNPSQYEADEAEILYIGIHHV